MGQDCSDSSERAKGAVVPHKEYPSLQITAGSHVLCSTFIPRTHTPEVFLAAERTSSILMLLQDWISLFSPMCFEIS